ncbi:hypothetical protein ACFYKX_09445 [Cytobacillus sp. FJAT-54145]|uniref:Uncharacterized protein n=1 Tax=Cytobacillus spartinae TaxID=3299023 RepID=A0ABW6KDH7_9BACI
MFKRKEYTSTEYKNTSIVFFIISGFMLLGIMIAGFVEGFDKSAISPIILMVTSFIVGILYRRKGKRETNLSK